MQKFSQIDFKPKKTKKFNFSDLINLEKKAKNSILIIYKKILL